MWSRKGKEGKRLAKNSLLCCHEIMAATEMNTAGNQQNRARITTFGVPGPNCYGVAESFPSPSFRHLSFATCAITAQTSSRIDPSPMNSAINQLPHTKTPTPNHSLLPSTTSGQTYC